MNDYTLLLDAPWTRGVRRPVVLTGAGVSTGSGIPDFRGPHGLWTLDPAAESATGRKRHAADPAARAALWRGLSAPFLADARPNPAHTALARLDATILTQNVDGLHQAAGSPAARVHELHGSLAHAQCGRCRRRTPMAHALRAVREGAAEPSCARCPTGVLRPAVILFGEHLDRDVYGRAAGAARGADLFLAVGSSLRVEPAAALCLAAVESGATLVVVNDTPTPYDDFASALLPGRIEIVVPRIVAALLAGGTPAAPAEQPRDTGRRSKR